LEEGVRQAQAGARHRVDGCLGLRPGEPERIIGKE
jgi:hypothetical protein